MSSDDAPSDDVITADEPTATPSRDLAGFLKLPSTSFCDKNKPGYVPEEDDGKESPS